MTACLKLLYLKNQSFNESVDLLFLAKVLLFMKFFISLSLEDR
ncbi:hypothetical protein DNAOFDDG_01927 [Mannheimia haemolytica]|uniref:Uncharacterized protein n=1 Tax=Mannheimia haemolytica TaxID=75985 RepID=A0A378N206_MANHA|nr:hypothetical protein MHH_c19410 [Mannheimia haemolytica M42548]AGQ24803.1 hypothetical protein F382_01800 [Mannheimia haemolytica D153]AGQ37834.1 hypothetical protein J450_01260 [Mannheimia haemolytica D171]AGQ40257.1 hypothetical protein J451_01585 [Mannheimia haemolytica D174]AGR74943.1 hypothetical protein N220_06325 [Mannheimia haemolytica USMARC_2286]EDN74567.1 hypothetical protein MHA_1654 [Mannheimia haemolytica PHL213]EEY12856.1 hypothetical protein COK_0970 [Mannheimia haemolytica